MKFRSFSLLILIATCVKESIYGFDGGLSAKFGLDVPPMSSAMVTEKDSGISISPTSKNPQQLNPGRSENNMMMIQINILSDNR